MRAVQMLVGVFCLVWVAHIATAGEIVETSRMRTLEKKAMELAGVHGAENVLVALDCDNTILAMNQDLGSDQWFTWQFSLLGKSSVDPELRVANEFEGLAEVFGFLLRLSDMSPPEKSTPALVSRLQSKGFPTIVLTARDHAYMYSTIKALGANGFDFTKTSPQPSYPVAFLPYDPSTVGKEYGFSKSQRKSFKLRRKPRPVVYSDGVFYASGQHKGAMLRILLKRTAFAPKAIVFADDKKKHTKRVMAAYNGIKDVDVWSFRYGKEDPKVKAFGEKARQKTAQQWQRLRSAYFAADPQELNAVVSRTFVKSK